MAIEVDFSHTVKRVAKTPGMTWSDEQEAVKSALVISVDPDARAVLADYWEEQGRLDVAMLYRDMLPEPTRKRRKCVDKLTEAERQKMPEWAQRWIAIGRSTQPADRPLAEAAIRACYRYSGLDDKIPIIWTPSPLVCVWAASQAALRFADHSVRHDEDDVSLLVKRIGSVRDAVRTAVRSTVDDAVRGAVGDAVNDAVNYAVNGAVDYAVRDAVDDAVRSTVGDAVRSTVDAAVRSAVNGAVYAAVGGKFSDLWWRYLGGQFWVGGWWGSPSYLTYFLDVCGLDIGRDMELRARAYAAACSSACWWWPHHRYCMVSERPHTLEIDGNRLRRVAWEGWEVRP